MPRVLTALATTKRGLPSLAGCRPATIFPEGFIGEDGTTAGGPELHLCLLLSPTGPRRPPATPPTINTEEPSLIPTPEQVVIPGRPVPSARQRVAAAKGLPTGLVNRLRGDTEAELAADADRLLALVRDAAGPAPQATGEDLQSTSKHGTILTTLGRDLQANAARTPQRPDRPEQTGAAWRTDRGPRQQTRRVTFSRP